MRIGKIVIAPVFIIMSLVSQAQLLDNKVNIYLGYSAGSFPGRETTEQGSFISPSLYASYNRSSGHSLKCMINHNGSFSYGLSYDYLFADTWESSEYLDFNGSSAQIFSVSPIIRFKSMFREKGLFNRLQAFMEFGPNFGISNLSLTNPVFEIRDDSGLLAGPMESSDLFLGLKSNLGIDYSLNQSIGFYLCYSIDVNRITSKFYSDAFFIRSCINAGLLFKLKKDKYFYRTRGNY